MQLIVETQCPRCHRVASIEVEQEAYERWIQGELIQKAFPEMSAENRERLKTGICGRCWDKMFS